MRRRQFVKKTGYAIGTIESLRNFQEFSDQSFTKEGTIDRIESNGKNQELMVILVPNHRSKQFVVRKDKFPNKCLHEGDKVNVTYQKKAPSKDTEVIDIEPR